MEVKWLLVVLVMNMPVKTDLVFPTLDACMTAEFAMRQKWADYYNAAIRNKASKETLDMISRQTNTGTCIPTK